MRLICALILFALAAPLYGQPAEPVTETCAGKVRGSHCWTKVEAPLSREDCHFWNTDLYPGETFKWMGEGVNCYRGRVDGQGTLTKFGADGRGPVWMATGRMIWGVQQGQWTVRAQRGYWPVEEGIYQDGLRQGWWTYHQTQHAQRSWRVLYKDGLKLEVVEETNE